MNRIENFISIVVFSYYNQGICLYIYIPNRITKNCVFKIIEMTLKLNAKVISIYVVENFC